MPVCYIYSRDDHPVVVIQPSEIVPVFQDF